MYILLLQEARALSTERLTSSSCRCSVINKGRQFYLHNMHKDERGFNSCENADSIIGVIGVARRKLDVEMNRKECTEDNDV